MRSSFLATVLIARSFAYGGPRTTLYNTRRSLLASALGASSILAPPRRARADLNSTREVRLAQMRAADAEKDRLCEGRRGGVDYEVGAFDMTFDPPCYISGIWELLFYSLLVGLLKLSSDMAPDESEEGQLYRRLDVESDASLQDIKNGYRAQARMWHPDKWLDGTEEEQRQAQEKFKAATAAYELLLASSPGRQDATTPTPSWPKTASKARPSQQQWSVERRREEEDYT